ncbi:hypothetical protein LJB63_27130, partial [[Eubacterium] rectale]|nr:hypothetical protein [Agathobacter rectalis]
MLLNPFVQHEEPFSRRRYGKGQVFPYSGIPGHVGGYAALPDQAEREAVLHARQGMMVRIGSERTPPAEQRRI